MPTPAGSDPWSRTAAPPHPVPASTPASSPTGSSPTGSTPTGSSAITPRGEGRLWVSVLLGAPVDGREGQLLGRVSDVLARLPSPRQPVGYPVVTGLLVERGELLRFVPIERCAIVAAGDGIHVVVTGGPAHATPTAPTPPIDPTAQPAPGGEEKPKGGWSPGRPRPSDDTARTSDTADSSGGGVVGDQEVLVCADVLSHRMIDLSAVRLVRGYDVALAHTRLQGWVVAGVDTRPSSWWLRVLHRLPGLRTDSPSGGDGFGGTVDRDGAVTGGDPVSRGSGLRSGERGRGRDWHGFAPLIGHPPTVAIRAPLEGLRAPQIADLLEGSSPVEQAELLTCLRADPELEADVFEELDRDQQTTLLGERGDTEIAAVLARMHADDAADAIAELPQDRRRPVLDRMPAGPRGKVIALLGYNPATAGGLMGLDFLAVAERTPIGAVVNLVRDARHLPPEALSTIFSLAEDGALAGAAGLVTLLQADPAARLAELTDTDPVRVRADTDLTEVTRLMTDYNLLALPVVDGEEHLVGVITVDDALHASLLR